MATNTKVQLYSQKKIIIWNIYRIKNCQPKVIKNY